VWPQKICTTILPIFALSTLSNGVKGSFVISDAHERSGEARMDNREHKKSPMCSDSCQLEQDTHHFIHQTIFSHINETFILHIII